MDKIPSHHLNETMVVTIRFVGICRINSLGFLNGGEKWISQPSLHCSRHLIVLFVGSVLFIFRRSCKQSSQFFGKPIPFGL